MPERTYPTLPSSFYFDPNHHQTELQKIWSREWICIAHESQFPESGQYCVHRLGTAQIIITRKQNGEMGAFHNTCRHRGSQLCEKASGKFKNGRVVCPYHGWVYSLDGTLTHTPRRIETSDFNSTDFNLYPVTIETWRGFVFINLAENPQQTLSVALGAEADILANWPLEDLQIVHQEISQIECNWKIFWENYCECPAAHPQILAPIA